MQQRTLGWILFLAGVFLLVSPSLMATVVVDTTPPTIVSNFPDYTTYSTAITKAVAHVKDNLGVAAVYFSCAWKKPGDVEKQYYIKQQLMTMVNGTKTDGFWQYVFPEPLTEATEYVAYFQVGDEAGNWINKLVVFQICYNLAGDWYINDVKVTSPSQVLKFKTNTLTFKFVQTAGTPRAQDITVTVKWSGPTSGMQTLAFKQMQPVGTPPTWEATLTFPDGFQALIGILAT